MNHSKDHASGVEIPKGSDQTPEVFVTNFHRRFTGVSATANAVVSGQKSRLNLCLVGDPLPDAPEPLSYQKALRSSYQRPANRPFSIWHVRRNMEMSAAIFARDVLRLPIRIVFTSAAIRRHSAFPRALISRMDAVVATTETAGSFVPNLASVVPHGVDTQKFTPADDRIAAWQATGLPGKHGIGIVGRVRAEKGTDLFVESMCELLPQNPDFTAVVIGRAKPEDSTFEKALNAKIDACGLTDRIVFVGEVPSHELPTWMRSLSLLVAPARYEGYGMTPLEALSSGVPVVAADTGVYASVIEEGVTGHVVPIGDRAGLQQAIQAMIQDPSKLETAGQLGRTFAMNSLSLNNEVDGYQQVYDRLWEGESFRARRAA
ncbi:glycosyltransferase family 4 protein [Rhodopirellula bahusiensis]|uniref:Lipopolysaccharide biosynthesis protein n=1 Tax=Rhodopirellula bahusiensis TaxID=2014065 RepID=A0A2G1WEC0_9BACT|nr:glycosyltransferase family 4 protein [Rhodopirellula bahusiensis]PHQ37260.1 lipopolysaccharide biosynthesis protein [Rhodopirellula bahusiensis]